ncbi:isoprenylcysteine carboxyl methyltransferase family protein [Pasteurellaceae bacterium LIM206]|nr:isoprenylcysteine carboxyl methyltransferase family protein [Pasteurellaceae bacterium LIM206]
MFSVNLIFIIILLTRFYSLYISKSHEKLLLQKGAVEYGKLNSKCLSIAHVAFYLSAIVEANMKHIGIDRMSLFGLLILIFAIAMLFYIIYQLKEIWTVKLYILPRHDINRSFLFSYIRHPNYFLNIIPELIGLALFCHATTTAYIGLPIYLVFLITRIVQEERAMAHLR